MTMVLQIIDLLPVYIKYESQESIVMYISNHWMETTKREGMSILLEGFVICTLQKKNPPEKIYGTRNLFTK